jgi:hypothetical protein
MMSIVGHTNVQAGTFDSSALASTISWYFLFPGICLFPKQPEVVERWFVSRFKPLIAGGGTSISLALFPAVATTFEHAQGMSISIVLLAEVVVACFAYVTSCISTDPLCMCRVKAFVRMKNVLQALHSRHDGHSSMCRQDCAK